MAGYDLRRSKLYGRVTQLKTRTGFLAFSRYQHSLHPVAVRILIVLDKSSPHRST